MEKVDNSAKIGFGIAALVLGIVSILTIAIGIGVILAILAIIFGIISLKHKIAKGFAITGIVTGGVGLLIGLIFLMTFLALPLLQQSQRDTQRKNDLARLQTALVSYQSNNRGQLPLTDGKIDSTFEASYLEATGDTFVDPSGPVTSDSGMQYTLTTAPENPLTQTFTHGGQNVIFYTVGATCDPKNNALTVSAGSTSIALQMTLEGGGISCLSN